jgi:hypothetical protein
VKLSVLAGRLEKPFRLFICRYWHCVFEEVYGRRLSFADLRRKRAFSWQVGSVGHSSLSWVRPPFSGSELSLVGENCTIKIVWLWLGVILSWLPLLGILLVGCVLLMLAVFPISRGCVFFPCCVGVKKGCCKSTSPCCWSTSLWGYLLHMEGR